MIRQDYYVYTYSYPESGIPFYVGKGTKRRDRVHLCDAKAGRNSDKFAVRIISKLLQENQTPVIERIADSIDEELALFIEEEFIDKYGRKDIGTGILSNCTSGGDRGAPALSAEAKYRQTQKFIEWSKNERVVDDEYRKKISAGLKEYYSTHTTSPETCKKRSEAALGEKNHFYGKTHSDEIKEHLRKVNTGKTLSAETKDKIREAAKISAKKRKRDSKGHFIKE